MDRFIHIKSGRFSILPGEKEELVSDGMYGKALAEPFHVYSMQQAIKEEFILDVLRNYTTYKLAFRLANGGKEWDETEVEHGEEILLKAVCW